MSYLRFQKNPFPRLGVHCHNDKVRAVTWEFSGTRGPTEYIDACDGEIPFLKELLQDLKAYFEGRTTTFDWPLDWEQGTPFQRKVWRALQKIPYGQTRSYQWIADTIGNPQAVRAIGNANAKNPFSLVIPCHRIIRKDGGIGGYTGGISIKRQLLSLERRSLGHSESRSLGI